MARPTSTLAQWPRLLPAWGAGCRCGVLSYGIESTPIGLFLWSNATLPSPPSSPSSKMGPCCKPTADDGLMMIHTSVVMVRCPATGRELSTGVEMDAATFERLPDIRSRMNCPVCSLDHDWSTREAWLGNPAPSAPALPWLFINNLSAAND